LDDTLRILEEEEPGGGARGRWLVRVRDGEVEAYEVGATRAAMPRNLEKGEAGDGQEEEVKGDGDGISPQMTRGPETMGEYALIVESELAHIHRMIRLVTDGFAVGSGTNTTSNNASRLSALPAKEVGIDDHVETIQNAIASMVSEAQEAFVDD